MDEMNEVVNDLATFIDLSFKNTKSRSFVNEDCSSCCSKQDQAGFSRLHSGSRPRYLVSYGRYGCALSRMRLDRIIKRCSKFQTFFLFCSEFLVRFSAKLQYLQISCALRARHFLGVCFSECISLTAFFPTCQVRVSRFYQSWPAHLRLALLRLCLCFNCELQISVGTAGPQLPVQDVT